MDHLAIGTLAQHDTEFIATEAPAQAGFADIGAQPFGHAFQQFVAHQMPQRIVDRLEPVEVDHQKGTATAELIGTAHRRIQRLGQLQAIGQPGQRVKAGEIGDLFFTFAAFSDIRTDPAKPDESAVVIDAR
jgi:hypothetical protein